MTETLYPKLIEQALTTVTYAGTKKNIVESGMLADTPVVERITSAEEDGTAEKWHVKVLLEFPRKTDPFMRSTMKAAEAAIKYHCGQDIDVTVEATFSNRPEPKPQKMLPHVGHIIAVSSGKGGVGKSTVAANLAVSLARLGYKTGLLDCDVFGPSVPKMFGVEDARPYAVEVDGKQLIEPIEKYGIKLLSIGFFVDPGTATIWRGGMATSALKQLIGQADWGDLDFLVLDTPPGTSDIHLTLLQSLDISGALIVSTPQQVALADARKGIDMYTNEKVQVPILGLVENMAWFEPKEHPGERYYLFGREGVKQLAMDMHVPLLAQIPLVQSICESGDEGEPIVLDANSSLAQSYLSLSQAVASLSRRGTRV